MELTTKEGLEEWSTGLEIVVVPQTVQEPAVDEENILEISGELAERMEPADQIVVHRQIPVEEFEEEEDTDSKPVLTSVEDSGSEEGDIVCDAKFFQDAVTELQQAYQSLDEKYTHQSFLVKEASEALKASESHVTELQGELKALLQNRNKDIQVAVSQAVVDYEQKLSKEQSRIQTQQSVITELQGQVHVLQISVGSQRDLSSVGTTQEGVNLRDEVFNYVPGTVNTNWGTAVYQSPEQAFSFQKHV